MSQETQANKISLFDSWQGDADAIKLERERKSGNRSETSGSTAFVPPTEDYTRAADAMASPVSGESIMAKSHTSGTEAPAGASKEPVNESQAPNTRTPDTRGSQQPDDMATIPTSRWGMPLTRPGGSGSSTTLALRTKAQATDESETFFSYSYDLDPSYINTVRQLSGKGLAVLADFKWQIGIDGSATIYPSPGHRVYGMVYSMTSQAVKELDMQELYSTTNVKKFQDVLMVGDSRDVSPLQATGGSLEVGDAEVVKALLYVAKTINTGILETIHTPPYLIRGFHAALSKGMPVDYVDSCLRTMYGTLCPVTTANGVTGSAAGREEINLLD